MSLLTCNKAKHNPGIISGLEQIGQTFIEKAYVDAYANICNLRLRRNEAF